jgi:glutamine amidotransferase
MSVVIIDYGAGNIFSVQQAFRRIGIDTVLSSDETEIRSASHVVFPGVGHAKPAMENLSRTGLDKVIPSLKQPVLGICLGMQLMCGWNEEGNLKGLDIFDTPIFDLKSGIPKLDNLKNPEFGKSEIREFDNYRRLQVNAEFQPKVTDYKFPHMGWNDVLTNGISEAYYFVHSYAAEICEDTLGVTEYPFPFSASLRKDNFLGVQFHPEKSGKAGEEFLKNFLSVKTCPNSQISK